MSRTNNASQPDAAKRISYRFTSVTRAHGLNTASMRLIIVEMEFQGEYRKCCSIENNSSHNSSG
jgi:hypothetical protein